MLLLLFSPVAREARAQSTHTPWQHLTQSQLTAVWWQWALGIPVSNSPLFDETGIRAYSGQPYSDLLFLGGTFIVNQAQNGDVLGEVTRSITIRRGTALFFPLLNGEWDNVGVTPHLGGTRPSSGALSVPELQAIVAVGQDNVTGLYATLKPTDATFQNATGLTVSLDHPRLKSPPFSFVLPRTDTSRRSSRRSPAARPDWMAYGMSSTPLCR